MAPNMQGLTDDQIEELHLVDEWAARCQPSGGAVDRKDPVGRRSGQGEDSTKVQKYSAVQKFIMDNKEQ